MLAWLAACGGGGDAGDDTVPDRPVDTSAKLVWFAPSERTDGTPLTDLAGFNVYYGTDYDRLHQRIWIANPSAITWTVEGLKPARWFFAITAVDSQGRESNQSWIVYKEIR
jgi:hypothetical protein